MTIGVKTCIRQSCTLSPISHISSHGQKASVLVHAKASHISTVTSGANWGLRSGRELHEQSLSASGDGQHACSFPMISYQATSSPQPLKYLN